jgi:hypothetical protein
MSPNGCRILALLLILMLTSDVLYAEGLIVTFEMRLSKATRNHGIDNYGY